MHKHSTSHSTHSLQLGVTDATPRFRQCTPTVESARDSRDSTDTPLTTGIAKDNVFDRRRDGEFALDVEEVILRKTVRRE
jgi:hypothetical protein